MEASVEGKAGENRHAKEHRQPAVTEKAGPASQHPREKPLCFGSKELPCHSVWQHAFHTRYPS